MVGRIGHHTRAHTGWWQGGTLTTLNEAWTSGESKSHRYQSGAAPCPLSRIMSSTVRPLAPNHPRWSAIRCRLPQSSFAHFTITTPLWYAALLKLRIARVSTQHNTIPQQAEHQRFCWWAMKNISPKLMGDEYSFSRAPRDLTAATMKALHTKTKLQFCKVCRFLVCHQSS